MGDLLSSGESSGYGAAAGAAGQLLPLIFGSGKQTTSTNTNAQLLDPATLKALQAMINPNGQYGKVAAQTDATGAMSNAMRILMQQGFPEISGNSNNSGAYNNTTTALESNDLASRVASQGAALQLDNINNYANLQTAAANILKGATVNETQAQTQQTGSMCFITTAVCKARYRPDNCDELQTLRNFRDQYMRIDPARNEFVTQYYQEAPEICARLDAIDENERLQIYLAFDYDYIQPAVRAIKVGDNEFAMNIYIALFETAKEIAYPKQESGEYYG